MLQALADGEANPTFRSALADKKLRATQAQLCDAVSRQLFLLSQSVVGCCLSRCFDYKMARLRFQQASIGPGFDRWL